MDKLELEQIQEELRAILDEKRYRHTIGVMYTAASLAMAHGEDPSKAMLAGLLHDCAKCLSLEEMNEWCQRAGYLPTEMEARNKNLLHAKAGAAMARLKFEVGEEEILSAISYHATGRDDMRLLEKIVYLADYIEPWRNPIPKLEEIRQKSFQNIDLAVAETAENVLNYLADQGWEIDPTTRDTLEFYRNAADETVERSK